MGTKLISIKYSLFNFRFENNFSQNIKKIICFCVEILNCKHFSIVHVLKKIINSEGYNVLVNIKVFFNLLFPLYTLEIDLMIDNTVSLKIFFSIDIQ